MDLTLGLIILILIAGFIKGFSGFGLSIILISVLLEMNIPNSELMPILVPLFVLLDIGLYIQNRKHINLDFKENFTLHPTTLMTLFIGTMIGTYFLTITQGEWLKLTFAILVLMMLFLLVRKVDIHQMKTPSEQSNGFFGFGTGILSGMFTMNAVPPSIYLMYHQYPKEKYMAALVTFLLFSDIILVAVYMFKGLFTHTGLIISLKLFSIVFLGFFTGAWIRKYVSTTTFKSIIIAVLAINSLKIIFSFLLK